MLYQSADDFFSHAASIQQISRQEEKLLHQSMKEGSPDAEAALTESYLPILAAYLKQYVNAPSLQLIYCGLDLLSKSVRQFDFQADNPTFTHYFSIPIKRMVIQQIAEQNNPK